MTEIHTRTIEEHRVDGKPLGRHVAHDPRSREFPAEQASKITDVVHTNRGLPLDQSRGSCTAEAFCGCGNTDPDWTGKIYTQADADSLYDEEIILEGGDPATDDPGGTGLYVCRAAKKFSWVKSYHHAFGVDHALKALMKRPVMIGSNWYEGFDRPDAEGVVQIAGQVRGGHEYEAFGYLAEPQLVVCMQSWGPGFGKHGVFYLPVAALDRLLGEEGDVTVPYPV